MSVLVLQPQLDKSLDQEFSEQQQQQQQQQLSPPRRSRSEFTLRASLDHDDADLLNWRTLNTQPLAAATANGNNKQVRELDVSVVLCLFLSSSSDVSRGFAVYLLH